MERTLLLTILTPEKTLLEADAVLKVRLRLADGAWLSVLPRHAPLVAEIAPGEVQVTAGGSERTVSIGPGILQISSGRVVIIAGRTQKADDVTEDGTDAAKPLRFVRLERELLSVL